MKITIYELLGMIKDGKAPKRFKYDISEWVYNYESSAYWNGRGVEFENYMDDGLMKYLNDEVEIIEEPQEHKIPEKLNIQEMSCRKKWLRDLDVWEKINEILDYLEEIE